MFEAHADIAIGADAKVIADEILDTLDEPALKRMASCHGLKTQVSGMSASGGRSTGRFFFHKRSFAAESASALRYRLLPLKHTGRSSALFSPALVRPSGGSWTCCPACSAIAR